MPATTAKSSSADAHPRRVKWPGVGREREVETPFPYSMSGHLDGIAGLTSFRRELTRLGFAEVYRDHEERIRLRCKRV